VKKGNKVSNINVSSGVTLVELVIVMVILGILAAIGSGILLESADIFVLAKARRDVLAEGRYAIERISREIREEIEDPAADITSFTATNFTFTDPDSNSISFFQSGSTLLRNSDLLASSIDSLSFSYLEADGTTAAAAADIWRIGISLTLAAGGESTTLRSEVFPRNFYDDNAGFDGWSEQ